MNLAPEHTPAAALPGTAPSHRLEIVRRLVAAMMLGQLIGSEAEVRSIYRPLAAMLKDEQPLRLGLAFASALSGDASSARQLIADSGGDGSPSDQINQLCVALALKVAADPAWRQIVDRVLAANQDDDVCRLAHRIAAHSSSSKGFSQSPPQAGCMTARLDC